MKYFLIILLFTLNSCIAKELVIKDPIIDFDKVNIKKIYIDNISIKNEEYNEISRDIYNNLLDLFKKNTKIEIVNNKDNSDAILEQKILNFEQNIYFDQYNSQYSINNSMNDRNSANFKLFLSINIKIINKDNILLDENINNSENIQLNNINTFQVEDLKNKDNTIYLNLKNKILQDTIKKISYYINPSYTYKNINEN